MSLLVKSRIKDSNIDEIEIEVTIRAKYKEWILIRDHLETIQTWPVPDFWRAIDQSISKLSENLRFFAKG